MLYSLVVFCLLWYNKYMVKIDGKALAGQIKLNVKQKVQAGLQAGLPAPKLACIIVEGNSASEVYVASKEKACSECLMQSQIVRLRQDVSQSELEQVISSLNSDDSVSGILLQLPLPKHLNSERALSKISPSKDVDCLTVENLGLLFSGSPIIAPCTATGIIKILDSIKVEIAGKRAVVIGRSLLVGKSVANLLEQKNATVTICHSKTVDMEQITKQADILVVAVGKAEYITADYVKKGAIVIDVGINRTESGLKGDVDYKSVSEVCSYITPVPGGVGPLTVACLMENTLILDRLQRG